VKKDGDEANRQADGFERIGRERERKRESEKGNREEDRGGKAPRLYLLPPITPPGRDN